MPPHERESHLATDFEPPPSESLPESILEIEPETTPTRSPSDDLAIIDGDPEVRESLGTELIASQPQLQLRYSGDNALDVVDMDPAPTLVLLDIDLDVAVPTAEFIVGMSTRGSCIVIRCTRLDPDTTRTLIRIGASGIVAKVASRQELLAVVDLALLGGKAVDPTVARALADEEALNNPKLSDREQQVMLLFAGGLKIGAVARRLEVSPNTVKTHLKRIREKQLQAGRPVPTQSHMLREATRRGLVT